MSDSISEAYALIADLAFWRGARNLKDVSGLHEIPIDANWSAKLNPHEETCELLPAFCIAVHYEGWPVGILHPFEGRLTSMCPGEDALIEAVRAAKGSKPT